MPMTKQRTFVAFEIEPHLKAGLDAVKNRDGISLNFQVSKAIEQWLEERGITSITPKAKRVRKK
jgi:hypothetical protein